MELPLAIGEPDRHPTALRTIEAYLQFPGHKWIMVTSRQSFLNAAIPRTSQAHSGQRHAARGPDRRRHHFGVRVPDEIRSARGVPDRHDEAGAVPVGGGGAILVPE